LKEEGTSTQTSQTWSLPTRERGLKDTYVVSCRGPLTVAPYAGAWIERLHTVLFPLSVTVAPYAGAWIESLTYLIKHPARMMSLPTRERGLKVH